MCFLNKLHPFKYLNVFLLFFYSLFYYIYIYIFLISICLFLSVYKYKFLFTVFFFSLREKYIDSKCSDVTKQSLKKCQWKSAVFYCNLQYFNVFRRFLIKCLFYPNDILLSYTQKRKRGITCIKSWRLLYCVIFIRMCQSVHPSSNQPTQRLRCR